MSATLTTDLDLSNIKLIIPEMVMKDIGMKYRVYRYETVMGKRQLHDLSAMPPLKPATIARKMGVHKPMGKVGKTAFKASSKRTHKTGVVSSTPTIPLMDTGNMVAPNALNLFARDGLLEISQGPQRAEIALYHNEGMGNNPQRVHMSWNEEFVNTHIMPVVDAWVDLELRKRQGMRKVA